MGKGWLEPVKVLVLISYYIICLYIRFLKPSWLISDYATVIVTTLSTWLITFTDDHLSNNNLTNNYLLVGSIGIPLTTNRQDDRSTKKNGDI